MQEVRGSNPRSSTRSETKFENQGIGYSRKVQQRGGTMRLPASPDQAPLPARIAGIACSSQDLERS